MASWVLIIIIFGYGSNQSPATTTASFYTQKSCETARYSAEKQNDHVHAFCSPTGSETHP